MARKWIQSIDVEVDESGAIHVHEGFLGLGKPDLLQWAAGSDEWAQADSGAVSHDASVIFVRVGIGGALLSVADQAGQEKPFIIPPNYWREIAVPGGIQASSRIVARNFTTGDNFSSLVVEVR